MDIYYIIIIYLAIGLYTYTFAEFCAKQNTFLQFDIPQCHIKRYFQHLVCNTNSALSFYRCKITCLSQTNCIAFRHISFCEFCSYSDDPVPENQNLDFLHVKTNADNYKHLGKPSI